MKKLLFVLPLLLTACSSVQLKHEPVERKTMIHIQPYPVESHISAFICRDDKETPVISDWLRDSDLNHTVTVSYRHNGAILMTEGKLLQFSTDKVKLEQFVWVYFSALTTAYPIEVDKEINVSDIEFVLVEGNGEAY